MVFKKGQSGNPGGRKKRKKKPSNQNSELAPVDPKHLQLLRDNAVQRILADKAAAAPTLAAALRAMPPISPEAEEPQPELAAQIQTEIKRVVWDIMLQAHHELCDRYLAFMDVAIVLSEAVMQAVRKRTAETQEQLEILQETAKNHGGALATEATRIAKGDL